MTQVIFVDEDGTISTIGIHPDDNIYENAKRGVPCGVRFRIVDDADIPTDVQYQRAWKVDFSHYDGVGIGHARAIIVNNETDIVAAKQMLEDEEKALSAFNDSYQKLCNALQTKIAENTASAGEYEEEQTFIIDVNGNRIYVPSAEEAELIRSTFRNRIALIDREIVKMNTETAILSKRIEHGLEGYEVEYPPSVDAIDDNIFTIDMPVARDIHRDLLRKARTPLLNELDIKISKALAQGRQEDVAALEAKRQVLRDITSAPEIENAVDLSDLRAFWPLDAFSQT